MRDILPPPIFNNPLPSPSNIVFPSLHVLSSGVNGSVTLGGGRWIDAKGKVFWGTEVTQWGPGAKTQ